MQKRFTEEQIIGILKQHESGVKTADVCREHNISQNTFYKWKSKYGGLSVSEAQRLRQLEAENAKLKRIAAEQALDNIALKDLLSKNW
jgi:putative transposase